MRDGLPLDINILIISLVNFGFVNLLYLVGLKGLNVLLSRTQAGPGRAVKQEQEENSPNLVRTFYSDPVCVVCAV